MTTASALRTRQWWRPSPRRSATCALPVRPFCKRLGRVSHSPGPLMRQCIHCVCLELASTCSISAAGNAAYTAETACRPSLHEPQSYAMLVAG